MGGGCDNSVSALAGIIFAVAAFASLGAEPGATQVESFETPYNHITIERIGTIVEMRSSWRSRDYRESAVDLAEPTRLVVPYTKGIAASAIFHPKPQRVLMIGLGGGGFNQFFEKAFPNASLETVEIDPQVAALAQSHLGFKLSERNTVTIADGRMFLRQSKAVYDWIILDAFRGGFVPPHLKTVEFYKLAQAHLAPDGLFVANVHTNSSLFASDIRTMREVFPQLAMFDVPESGNAILVAANFISPTFEEMANKAGKLSFNDIYRRSVDPVAAVQLFQPAVPDPNTKGPVLTDDFAPTEFLDAVKTERSAH